MPVVTATEVFPTQPFSAKEYDSQIKTPIKYFVGAAFGSTELVAGRPRFSFTSELKIAARKLLPPLNYHLKSLVVFL